MDRRTLRMVRAFVEHREGLREKSILDEVDRLNAKVQGMRLSNTIRGIMSVLRRAYETDRQYPNKIPFSFFDTFHDEDTFWQELK